MRDHALELHDLMSNGSIDPGEVGRILDHGWQLKRSLASTISNDSIDDWYQRALEAGASGGKLCGAGGGGCILILAPPERHDAVREALHDLTEVPVTTRSTGPASSCRWGLSAMIFHQTTLPGAYLIDLERIEDERGFNARTWCEQEFADQGLTARSAQANTMFNHRGGTLRGMHWQVPPAEESKLFRVLPGAIHDVIVDLREGSDTYGQWESFRLSAGRRAAALRARALRAGLPDARGRHRGGLPGLDALLARATAAACATTIRRSTSTGRCRCEVISEKDKAGPTSCRPRPCGERA